ncbi:beta(1,3)galactosyltransferase EpsH [Bifidobacterium sp. 64T4]|uniref:PssE/Cps14G family polysaccharide biosynthesis glycosyltransferase n=1 Tax=Bifidobacterium pongonis TaxID=2834432 RepID=UPI001C5790CD|nr:PssE/Cps14G family polysaccharide biosynthesis glycosyltransferase [Bifidobacterium pongonis]MBW3095448.1 beta(1,3)galactosyltransferase EpsH [Bifidobacterium pongonis]
MIFVTVGSQKFQFNRLIRKVDELVASGEITEEVFSQIGVSDYIPKHGKYSRFLNRDEFFEISGECDIVITHGGTGAIIGAVKRGKKVIAVPRLAKYKEHVDDHQLQILHQFDEMGLILPCYDVDGLPEALKQVRELTFNTYESNTDTIVHSIERFIDGE